MSDHPLKSQVPNIQKDKSQPKMGDEPLKSQMLNRMHKSRAMRFGRPPGISSGIGANGRANLMTVFTFSITTKGERLRRSIVGTMVRPRKASKLL
jgi:hypothetical protein